MKDVPFCVVIFMGVKLYGALSLFDLCCLISTFVVIDNNLLSCKITDAPFGCAVILHDYRLLSLVISVSKYSELILDITKLTCKDMFDLISVFSF